jgi:ribonuclease BN (tRNA processing enzyme)
MMKITVLGAGTCLPYPNFSPSGYLLHLDKVSFLLDAGPGTIARMATHGGNYQELEYVLISHLHPDHVLDLFTLLQANNATPGWSRSQELTIIGCKGIKSFLDQQFNLIDGIKPETFSLQIFEMGAETLDFSSWSLTSALTSHTTTSLAYRITANQKSLVYSGDAANIENLVQLALDAQILVCECSLPDGWQIPDHLTPGQIGVLAQQARVEQVVLTHRYPQAIQADVISQVKHHYDGRVYAAIDGFSLDI